MTPRTLLPKDEQGSSAGRDSTPPKSSKRKAVSSACIPCRKRKSKCDGGLPSCSTCVAVYRTECSYDQDTDHRRKGALRKDIHSLQAKNNALDVIVNSLRSMSESDASTLVQSIRRGDRLDTLADTLSAGNPELNLRTLDTDLSEQIGTPSSSFHGSTPLQSTSSSRSPSERHRTGQQPQESQPDRPDVWFRIPQDAEFVQHLLDLYFSWVHPNNAFFSKELFLKDMSHGRSRYCTPLLINAVLSMACFFSDRPAAGTAGDYFYKEATELDRQTDEASLSAVQAIAVLAMREASAGRDHVSYRLSGRCIRMAMELGLHLKDPPETQQGFRATDTELRKITFWGIFNLEMCCCLCVGRPSALMSNAISLDLPQASDAMDNLVWQPYVDVNQPTSPVPQVPMKCLLYIRQFSKLHQIVNNVNLHLYAPKERFTARRLAAAYNDYQIWFNEMPEVFHLHNTAMPHVMNMHMSYYMCVLHLFRPFTKLDLSAIGLYPREICTYCATEISNLMNAMRGMYGLRRVPLSTTVTVTSAATIHMMNLPSPDAALKFTQALQDLHTMSINHRYAAYCIGIIERLSEQWGITLPETAKNISQFQPSADALYPNTPYVSVFFTQATLSNDPLDSLSSGGQVRHDSGSVYEPSFVQQSYTILPQHDYSIPIPGPGVQDIGTRGQRYSSTPLQTTPTVGSQTLWPQYQPQQMMHTDMSTNDYHMMSSTSVFSYNPYHPPN
ncbi:hypothetical protein AAFC00_002553 [Neodothiora populina]|uniref:Zn(2)-C6 fungal-type domain-containing protein n=1 Tax=Neodothiora populina TaxID=2781224 RepID=A0ABR3P7H0_9PEZI